MHVAAEFQQVAVGFYYNGLKAALVEVACSSVTAVEVGGVGDVEVSHEFGKVGLRGLHDQMKVVAHEDVGMKSDLVDLERCLKFSWELIGSDLEC